MSTGALSPSREASPAGDTPAARRTRTRVAAVQMVSGPEVSPNLQEAGHLIEMAAARGAELIALPEYFPIMGRDERDKVKVREEEGSGPIQAFLADAARRHKVWIVGGSVPLVASTSDKVRNTCLVFDHTGRRVARYDKIHLFWFEMGAESYSEPRTIEAGKEVVAFDSPFGRIGLSICYDLRFPELYRAMKAVDLILAPSAFTATTGKAHWETLIRARAIENLAYVLAPAQGGRHLNGRETNGDTMLVDPWGVVLDRLPGGAGVVVGDVDHERLAEVRRSLPALTHRTLG
jgi:deaminated glutathione amidase